jgi:RNA polymerase sigma-70 factor (ECF subfamily)
MEGSPNWLTRPPGPIRNCEDLRIRHGQVAEILAIPEATVKTRMFYARKRLSELLKAAGIDRGWP